MSVFRRLVSTVTASRFLKAVLVCVAVLIVLSWQRSMLWTKHEDTYRIKGFGFQQEAKFVYFLYYLNLFPLASTDSGRNFYFYESREHEGTPGEPSKVVYSKEAAQRLISERGSTLVTAWGQTIRDGQLMLTYVCLLHAWRLGSPQWAEVRISNAAFFALGLAGMFFALVLSGRPLLAVLFTAFLGSNPFQLWEIYGRDNVFGWTLITFCWVLALTLPFMGDRARRARGWHWGLVVTTALLCGTVAHVRTEPLAILGGVAAVYLTTSVFGRRDRLLAVFVLAMTFAVGTWTWQSYFDHKIAEATEVAARAGGHPFPGLRASHHTVWDTLWMGLGDFDTKHGYAFAHAASFRYAAPIMRAKYQEELPAWPPPSGGYVDRERIYFRYPLEYPHYFDVLRDKILSDVLHDPLWYAGILSKRSWRILDHTTPVQVRLDSAVVRLPFHGILALPLVALWGVRRDRFRLQFMAMAATTSATALVVFSGRNWDCFGIYHIAAVALALSAGGEFARHWLARRRGGRFGVKAVT